MKRDMDLIRKILFTIEANPHGFYNRIPTIEGYSEDQVGYHIYLMQKAGLVDAIEVTHSQSTSPEAIPKSLTWAGHDFLEACRDEGRWAKAKEIFNQMGGVTLDIAKQVLISLMQSAATQILTGGPHG